MYVYYGQDVHDVQDLSSETVLKPVDVYYGQDLHDVQDLSSETVLRQVDVHAHRPQGGGRRDGGDSHQRVQTDLRSAASSG